MGWNGYRFAMVNPSMTVAMAAKAVEACIGIVVGVCVDFFLFPSLFVSRLAGGIPRSFLKFDPLRHYM
jgi:hypothetical protein